MKKLLTIFLFLMFLFSNHAFSQVVDEGFEMATCTASPFYNGCVGDWFSTQGNPRVSSQEGFNSSTLVNPYEGNKFVVTNTRHDTYCLEDPERGSGIALNYNFEQGKPYKISYAITYRGNRKPTEARWALTSGLINQVGDNINLVCPEGHSNPIPSEGTQYLPNPEINRSSWVYNTHTFTPNENFSQLWFKEVLSSTTSADLLANVYIDAIKIEALCVDEPIAYQFEQADGTPDTEFTLCEYVFIDASATTLPITSYTFDIREYDENGDIVGFNRAFDPNHPTQWHIYGQPGDHMNITDIFQYPNTENTFDFVEGHSYKVKIETWDTYCNQATWTYEEFTIIESDCCEEAIQFHFEHEDTTDDNVFSICEDVYLDATGTNDSRGTYHLRIWEFDENGNEVNVNLQHTGHPYEGWAYGDAGDERRNVTEIFTNPLTEDPIVFKVGYTYQVEVALWINNCGGWTGLTKEFTIVDEDCTIESCENISAPEDLYSLPASLNWQSVANAEYYIVSTGIPSNSICRRCKFPAYFGPVQVQSNYYDLPLDLQGECFTWRVKAVCSDGTLSNNSYNACYGVIEDPKIKVPTDKKGPSLTTIYPNPSNGKITLSVNISYDSEVQIELYDMLGHKIKFFNETLQAQANTSTSINWDGRGQLAKGIYFFRFNTDLESFTKTIVIE